MTDVPYTVKRKYLGDPRNIVIEASQRAKKELISELESGHRDYTKMWTLLSTHISHLQAADVLAGYATLEVETPDAER